MYAPTAPAPAAMPTRASYNRAALYHYAPAPYVRRRNGPARSMAAALLAAGHSFASAQAWLNRQGAAVLAGQKPVWP